MAEQAKEEIAAGHHRSTRDRIAPNALYGARAEPDPTAVWNRKWFCVRAAPQPSCESAKLWIASRSLSGRALRGPGGSPWRGESRVQPRS